MFTTSSIAATASRVRFAATLIQPKTIPKSKGLSGRTGILKTTEQKSIEQSIIETKKRCFDHILQAAEAIVDRASVSGSLAKCAMDRVHKSLTCLPADGSVECLTMQQISYIQVQLIKAESILSMVERRNIIAIRK